jgi:hypothetical protein
MWVEPRHGMNTFRLLLGRVGGQYEGEPAATHNFSMFFVPSQEHAHTHNLACKHGTTFDNESTQMILKIFHIVSDPLLALKQASNQSTRAVRQSFQNYSVIIDHRL